MPGSSTEEDNSEAEVNESLKLAQEANESIQTAASDESASEEFKKEAAEISYELESILAEVTDKKSVSRSKDIVTRAKDVADRANNLRKTFDQSRSEIEKKSLLAKAQEASEAALSHAQETVRMAKTISDEDIFNESLKMLEMSYEIHYSISTLNLTSEAGEIKTWIEYSSKVIQHCSELQEKIKSMEDAPAFESLVRQAILSSQRAASVTLSAVYIFDDEGIDSSELRSLSEKAQSVYEAALATEEGDDKRAQEIINTSDEIIRIVSELFDKNGLDFSLVDQDLAAEAKEKAEQIIDQTRKYYSVVEVMVKDQKIEGLEADQIKALYNDIESLYASIYQQKLVAREAEAAKVQPVEAKATEEYAVEDQPALAAPIAVERKKSIRRVEQSSDVVIELVKKMSAQFEEFKKRCDKAGVVVADEAQAAARIEKYAQAVEAAPAEE